MWQNSISGNEGEEPGGNLKLASFWSKLRNVERVGIAKRCVELSSMFVSQKKGVLILLCFL